MLGPHETAASREHPSPQGIGAPAKNKAKHKILPMPNTIFVVLGMAGSGKTTFCHRLYSWLSETEFELDRETGLNKYIYTANLDPAVVNTKMPLLYDIREHVSVESLMREKKLGPNGAILTALNVFAAKIDQFIGDMERRAPKYTIIDTPGQIEMFSTSVSGSIIVKCLSGGKESKVVLVYVADGVESQRPQCFMCNMVYAASILYRLKEPLLVLVNKAEGKGADRIKLWQKDLEEFYKDLNSEEHISSTLQSISLWLEEFYREIPITHASSRTGAGKSEFFSLLRTKFSVDVSPETPPESPVEKQARAVEGEKGRDVPSHRKSAEKSGEDSEIEVEDLASQVEEKVSLT
jgi:GPN-loop GTPase